MNASTNNNQETPENGQNEALSGSPVEEQPGEVGAAVQSVEAAESDVLQNLTTMDIIEAVKDAQILVSYISRSGAVRIDDESLRIIIESKYLIAQGKWTAEKEVRFWQTYDKIAEQVQPVTIDTLRYTMPSAEQIELKSAPIDGPSSDKKPTRKTPASRAVFRYRTYAIFSLLALLAMQIYWYTGSELTGTLVKIFDERKEVGLQISEMKYTIGDDLENLDSSQLLKLQKLKDESSVLNQKLDAHYELLQTWNSVWKFGEHFEGIITPHGNFKYDQQLSELQETSPEYKEISLERSLYKARIRFYLNTDSANFVLSFLQTYLLPLLYGLLGAVTYILRNLSMEIKNLTYSYDSEIRFRLRLSLGALAGMLIGYFMKPEDLSAVGSFSSMTLAFLMGYSVELFFALMDKIITSISENLQTGKPKNGGAAPVDAPAALPALPAPASIPAGLPAIPAGLPAIPAGGISIPEGIPSIPLPTAPQPDEDSEKNSAVRIQSA